MSLLTFAAGGSVAEIRAVGCVGSISCEDDGVPR